jgi:NCS2 family nucleobase:cation symporter-2/xanthine permease XanP
MRAGIYADGITTVVSALIGSFPSTTYAQNNGVIQITGVASRYVGRWMAAILALLGLFPVVARWVTAMPPSVLGGLALMLFGLVSVAGLRLISQAGLSHRNALVVALSLAAGIGAPSQGAWLETLPPVLHALLESGVAAGGVMALILNLLLPSDQESPVALGSE